MYTKFKNQQILVGLLILAAVLLTSCVGSSDREFLNSSGWDRASLIGNTLVRDGAPLVLDEAGNIYVFLVDFMTDDQENYLLRVLKLNRQAEITWEGAFSTSLEDRPSKPSLFWNGQSLDLFWIQDHQLFTMQVTPHEKNNAAPILLSGDSRTDSYTATRRQDGRVTAWYSGPRSHPGVYALDPDDLTAPATLVDAGGIYPQVQFDSQDNLQAIWIHASNDNTRREVFFASYPGGAIELGIESLVYTIKSPSTSVVAGPVLGIANNNVYVFWSEEKRTGLEVGTIQAFYIFFPPGSPHSIIRETRFSVPESYSLAYTEYQEPGLNVGERALIADQFARGTSNITQINPNQGPADEMAVALRARLPYLRNKERQQVGVAYLADGVAQSYQLLSFTIANSVSPLLAQDNDNYMYITWLESEKDGNRVYFASTAPDIKTALKPVTKVELVNISLETIFGIMSGLFLIYIPLMWAVAPMAVMLVTSKLRRESESIFAFGTILSLGFSLVIYWVVKLTLLPSLLTYVPFTAWLPMITENWYPALKFGVPALITVISVFLAWRFTYKQDRRMPLFLLLIYMGIDGVLTMAIYGVVIYAAI
ncbi:MAG: hypothetical protein OEZ02_08090 [Anaerolineae bacterium]|nr:hypothetical protein [Anaerolineae bacterium]